VISGAVIRADRGGGKNTIKSQKNCRADGDGNGGKRQESWKKGSATGEKSDLQARKERGPTELKSEGEKRTGPKHGGDRNEA